jgi:hypothetical protein
LGKKIDRLWFAYLAESDSAGKADIEQIFELLAAKHLGQNYEANLSPFPPPAKKFAQYGDIELGMVFYINQQMYPFFLKSNRLKEHILIAGRSGSGKTNLAFVLMQNLIAQGIKVLAFDWKRSYRNLMKLQKNLRVYTIGRDTAPFRFNPLIPPSGCEPGLWIKLVVDIIANAYFGGEGVISLLVSGLDHLYREAGVYDSNVTKWPTIEQLLWWLRKAKLKGRAGMWQASAERILLAMTYGEFGKVLNTQDNSHIAELLDHNVVLEMDGLASNSDRTVFSESLTSYLYRYRLAQGHQKKLTNMIILEEAHNLLHKKSSELKESVLETSIRMIREYGMGYVFIDQSASLLSKVAFANSYATIALNQKLRSDIQAISGAMNLTEEQRDALNTLPVGTTVVRLADQFPQPFLVKVPLCAIKEGIVADLTVKKQWEGFHSNSREDKLIETNQKASSVVPPSDKNKKNIPETNAEDKSHPPPPDQLKEYDNIIDNNTNIHDSKNHPPPKKLSSEAMHFLQDIIAQPLSSTVARYKHLHLSRRRGDAVRRYLIDNGFVEPVRIATRTGQVVLYQLTKSGRELCISLQINPGPQLRESLEHRYWVKKAADYYKRKGYEISFEYVVKDNGMIDILTKRPGEQIAVEVETGKSAPLTNLKNAVKAKVDKLVFVATSPSAVSVCQKVVEKTGKSVSFTVELLTWLDVS